MMVEHESPERRHAANFPLRTEAGSSSHDGATLRKGASGGGQHGGPPGSSGPAPGRASHSAPSGNSGMRRSKSVPAPADKHRRDGHATTPSLRKGRTSHAASSLPKATA